MKPVSFDESNKVLSKPITMSDDECNPLEVFTDGQECISCWQPTLRERFYILFQGRIWLSVLSGQTQPPVRIWGQHPFDKKHAEQEDAVANA